LLAVTGDGVDEMDELDPPTPPRPAVGGRKEKTHPTGKGSDSAAAPLDVNRASAEELQRLPGVGPTLSSRILHAREQRPFKSVDDLRRVPGVGAKTLEKLRPLVTVGE
jgi:competence protein ComEA